MHVREFYKWDVKMSIPEILILAAVIDRKYSAENTVELSWPSYKYNHRFSCHTKIRNISVLKCLQKHNREKHILKFQEYGL